MENDMNLLSTTSTRNKSITEEYELTNVILGQGGYASVVMARHYATRRTCAVKKLDKNKIRNNLQMQERVRRECDIHSRLSHPNIVELYEIFESKDEVCLVLEYLTGGDLFDRIVKNGRMPEDQARPYARALFDAVHYLHELGIAHRDLKPENILFSEDGTVKLIDFGFAKVDNVDCPTLLTPIGSAPYLAPEVLSAETYNKSVDFWALGCTLYFMLVGVPPFWADTDEDIVDLASEGVVTFPPYLSESAKSLISGLLSLDPAKRTTALEALCHPWTSQGDHSSHNQLETNYKANNSVKQVCITASFTSPYDSQLHQLRESINKCVRLPLNEEDEEVEDVECDQSAPILVPSSTDRRLARRKCQDLPGIFRL